MTRGMVNHHFNSAVNFHHSTSMPAPSTLFCRFHKPFVPIPYAYLGGKGVKKAIKKIASGLKRDENKTWFSEISDKGIKSAQYL